MTQVDFYVLASGGEDAALEYACRLAEKAWRMGHRIYLYAPDEQRAARLDELLWSFRPDSFLPHARADRAADDETVVIGGGDDPGRHNDVLINLAPEIPDFFSRFHRVAEIVCQDPAWLASSRHRYKFYSDRGYPLVKHDVSR